MALSRNALAAQLRTMQGRTSKAPMQNVQLPTQMQRTSYKTPSGPAASAPQPRKAQGTDPVTLAKAGGLLGQIGKGMFNRPETMALDKASSANLGDVSAAMGGLLGSNVDVASNMAGNTAGNLANLPQPSMLGNGLPVAEGWSGAAVNAGELGNLSSVNDAVSNATEAANAATDATANASSWGLPMGAALGSGLSFAQGNYGAGAGQLAGAAAGSMLGPWGTWLGGMAGKYVGGLLD